MLRSRTFLPLLAALALSCDNGGEVDADTDTLPAPEPGELQAGFASATLGAPVGIGTIGNAPGGAANETPFAQIYAGTGGVFGEPGVEVTVISRGPGFEAIFVRMDSIGIFGQLRNAIVDELEARTGRAGLDDSLLFAATHTHSGPGRVLNTGTEVSSPLDIVADTFWPPYYERYIDQVASTVEAALEDLAPAELGTTTGYQGTAHSDRRCEDGSYENGSLPMLAIRRGGDIEALLVAYAIHGVAFGRDANVLSQDVSGAIEAAVEDRLSGGAMVSMLNAWAADMTIGSPEVSLTEAEPLNGDHLRVSRAGEAIAEEVAARLDDLVWTSEPDIRLATLRTRIDREVIGYESGVFPYNYGAVYCQGEQECDGSLEPLSGIDKACLPFSEVVPAPSQTAITVGRIGPYALTTFPGEPGTKLAEKIMGDLAAAHEEVEEVLFLGYTQDYLGYSILEEDWYLGGYEASGALWGPKQGAYLSSEVVRLYGAWMAGEAPEGEPERLDPFPYDAESYTPATATGVGTVVEEVAATVLAGSAVQLAVQGSDPWEGTPTVRVLDDAGEPVLRPGGHPVGLTGMTAAIDLEVSPPWSESASERAFTWRFKVATADLRPSGFALEPGAYNLEVSLPTAGEPVVVESAPFTVEAEDAD